LNSPWGVALAPAGFGAFSGDVLIGNFGDGRIGAFDSGTGNLVGQLNDTTGQPLSIGGLWAMAFGGGGSAGNPNILYFTAGPSGETHGLFGSLAAGTAAAGGDFTVGAGAQTLTVLRGGSSNLSIDVTGTGGFTGQVNLTCSGLPAGASCNFAQQSIQAGGTQAQVMLTVSVDSTYVAPPYSVARLRRHSDGMLAMLTTLGFGAFGCVLFGTERRRRAKLAGLIGLGLLAMVVMAQTGCGGSKSNSTGSTGNGSFTMTVTGTSGALTHSTNVTVTVQ